MVQYYGAGVQACYRGPRLFDTDSTRRLVTNTISWYKRYRSILNAPLVHLRRADGRDWDGWMHVNPNLRERAFLMVFNPTDQPIQRTIRLPLYYAGIEDQVYVKVKDRQELMVRLEDDKSIELPIQIPPRGYNWYVLRQDK